MSASEAISDATGTVLNGEYELLGPMPGETSAVYEAQRRSDGTRVAVRLLRGLSPAAAAVAAERARRALAVRHPSLASVLDQGSNEDGSLFVVSEFVDGTPLWQWADAVGIPPLHKVVDFVHQICLALQVARRHGLTHEFISPSNILILPVALGPGERVAGKLLDLGIIAGSRQVAPSVNSALFMAPEQLSDLQLGTASGRQTSPAANVYSAGALLYHLCTGGPPFRASSLRALSSAQAEQSLTRPSRINPQIPAPLDEIILRSLSIDPSNRYPSVAELGEALAFIVARTQSLAGRASAPPDSPARHASLPPRLETDDDEPDTHQVPLPPELRAPRQARFPAPPSDLPPLDPGQTARNRPLADGVAEQVLRQGQAKDSRSKAPKGLFSGPPAPDPRLFREEPNEDARETISRPPPASNSAPPNKGVTHTTTQGMPAVHTVPPPSRSSRPSTAYSSHSPRSSTAYSSYRPRPSTVRDKETHSNVDALRAALKAKASPARESIPLPAPPPPMAPPPLPRASVAPPSPPSTPEEIETVYGEPEAEMAASTASTGVALERIKLDVTLVEDHAAAQEATDGEGDSEPDPINYADILRAVREPKPAPRDHRLQLAAVLFLLACGLVGAMALFSSPQATVTRLDATEVSAPTSGDRGAAAGHGQESDGPTLEESANVGQQVDDPPAGDPAVAKSVVSRAAPRFARRTQPAPGRGTAQAALRDKSPASTTVAVAAVDGPAATRAGTSIAASPLPADKSAAARTSNSPSGDAAQRAAKTGPPSPSGASDLPQSPYRPALAAPQPAAPVAPAPLAARAQVVDLQVRGSLTTSVVKRAVERARADFSACYQKAAKAVGRNGYGAVSVAFDVDLRGRTRNVVAGGGKLPGLAECVQQAANRIVTGRAPDTGTVHASFKVSYTP